jgi:hypothetical protein
MSRFENRPISLRSLTKSQYNKFITLIGDWVDGDLKRKPQLRNLLAKLPGITKTVYRGQYDNTKINPTLYFSTSTSVEDAELFSKTSCCMFKIHLINVPAFYIGDLFSDLEKEYLVLGGGTFWKNKECTKNGYKKIKEGLFECWYKVSSESILELSPSDIEVQDPTKPQQCTPGINCIISGGRGNVCTFKTRKSVKKTKKRYT